MLKKDGFYVPYENNFLSETFDIMKENAESRFNQLSKYTQEIKYISSKMVSMQLNSIDVKEALLMYSSLRKKEVENNYINVEIIKNRLFLSSSVFIIPEKDFNYLSDSIKMIYKKKLFEKKRFLSKTGFLI